ncbi:unnamed protein product [Calypogeia fissa]
MACILAYILSRVGLPIPPMGLQTMKILSKQLLANTDLPISPVGLQTTRIVSTMFGRVLNDRKATAIAVVNSIVEIEDGQVKDIESEDDSLSSDTYNANWVSLLVGDINAPLAFDIPEILLMELEDYRAAAYHGLKFNKVLQDQLQEASRQVEFAKLETSSTAEEKHQACSFQGFYEGEEH